MSAEFSETEARAARAKRLFNETVWPWYGEVAPVHEGRKELNFSISGDYSPAQRRKKLKEISEEAADGDMPPWYYVYPMHPDALLSEADRRALDGWIESERDGLK